MKKVLVIGAGRSATSLIKYLLKNAERFEWEITVCDQDFELAQNKINGHPRAKALQFDINDEHARRSQIKSASIVISMLPAHMHIDVAKECIENKIPMVTASYVSPEMKALDGLAKESGIILMNEVGVDPGIDHMSAMKLIDTARSQGAELKIFESFTGGLLARESEKDNPWKYKFTWNPRNVVLAGAGGAVKFKQEGKYKYIPYHQLFRRTEVIEINGNGRFEGYANRDSLKYRSAYGLEEIPTIYRGTLRRPGFCRAWDVFVKLGMTDDSYRLENSEQMTYREFTNTFLAFNPTDSVELKLMHYLGIPQDSDIMDKIVWSGLFSDKKVGVPNATPAMILEKILKDVWTLNEDERDMIVMYHKLGYIVDGHKKMIESSMIVEGDNNEDTAMAKTVGLPVGIATKQILTGEIKLKGVQIPIKKEIYDSMLSELSDYGIRFVEKEIPYQGY
ncbi:MAG: saccharopine dehydrogenase NADP-binding domain-containing protein [Schleiferiaceae bacterium]|nr:saccharopine dehydrogenase NADP-binding domain-containing protein [Schleiferiaceae bacterium]